MAQVEFEARTGHIADEIVEDTFHGLVHACEFLLGESRAVVPLEEGTLERSGAVTPDRENDSVIVSYDTPYAVRQHEELTWKHAPGRTAKYLEGPAHESRDAMLAIVAAHARREMELH